MKRLLLLVLVIVSTTVITKAQSPDMFNYQAVARDDQGNVLSNQDVGVKISILQNSTDGTVVYEEEHTKTTNDQGLVNLKIGDGSVMSGTFSNIDWSSGPFFIKVGLDASGGSSYSTMGTSQLVSVPYAKYSESSGNSFSGDYQDLSDKLWMSNNDTIFYSNSKVGIGTDSLSGNLTVQGDGGPIDFTIRDNYSFLQLNASQGNAGVWLSYNNNVKGNLWYNHGDDNVTISRTNFSDNDFVIDASRNIGINESSPAEQLDVNGAVRVQDTTDNPEPGTVYANSTPIAYGEISTNGSIRSGAYGIQSVNRVSTGEYEITLRNGFSEYASVSITTWDSSTPEVATYEHFGNTNQINVHIWDMSSSRTDSDFSIVVYGLPEGAKKKKKSETNINKNRTGVSQE